MNELWLMAYTVKHEPQIGVLSNVLQTSPGTIYVSATWRRVVVVAVNHRPFFVETWVWSRTIQCGIFRGQNSTGTFFSPHYFDASLSVPLSQCSVLSLLPSTLFVISVIRNVVK